jgi:hypothetical protein
LTASYQSSINLLSCCAEAWGCPPTKPDTGELAHQVKALYGQVARQQRAGAAGRKFRTLAECDRSRVGVTGGR